MTHHLLWVIRCILGPNNVVWLCAYSPTNWACAYMEIPQVDQTPNTARYSSCGKSNHRLWRVLPKSRRPLYSFGPNHDSRINVATLRSLVEEKGLFFDFLSIENTNAICRQRQEKDKSNIWWTLQIQIFRGMYSRTKIFSQLFNAQMWEIDDCEHIYVQSMHL